MKLYTLSFTCWLDKKKGTTKNPPGLHPSVAGTETDIRALYSLLNTHPGVATLGMRHACSGEPIGCYDKPDDSVGSGA